jgi:hypothetical protein
MRGKELAEALTKLSTEFYNKSIPSNGRYVPHPAVANSNGITYVPPKKPNINNMALKAFGVSALVALGLVYTNYRKKRKTREIDNFLDVEYNY